MSSDEPEWWVRTLAGETVGASEHLRLAQELMAFSERTARANPGKFYACVKEDTERAKVHAILAAALALNDRAAIGPQS